VKIILLNTLERIVQGVPHFQSVYLVLADGWEQVETNKSITLQDRCDDQEALDAFLGRDPQVYEEGEIYDSDDDL
jgi:hypothetical protein